MKILLTIRSKLLMAAFGVLLIAGTILVVLNLTVVHKKFEARLQLRGVTIARLLVSEVVNYVLTEQFAALELLLKDHLGDEQDIEYAFVTDKAGSVIAHTFSGGFPNGLRGINRVPTGDNYATMSFSTEKILLIDVAVPLLKGEVGQLHIGLSETSIRQQTKEIIWLIFWLILAIMIFAGIVFTLLAHIITNPLIGLARTADKASQGDFNVHFEVLSHDETGNLAKAFNNMIAARKQIEDDRERVIAELQTALREIKTLSGLLPICAWCKKVRDDKGYWTMVEVWVAQHTDAQFTHGICPDCLKEVSRETFERLDQEQKSTYDTSAGQDNL